MGVWKWRISQEEEPIIDFVNPGQYPVTLTTTSQYGCVSTHSEMVNISTQLEIFAPNAFTPSFEGAGTPGINDAFTIEFSNLSTVEHFHIQIFNRWGILVWESFDQKNIGWGKLINLVSTTHKTRYILGWQKFNLTLGLIMPMSLKGLLSYSDNTFLKSLG